MKQAIEWADGCKPKYDKIPKVGAIIAVGDKAIGWGRRGNGNEGDDQHAERKALESVEDESLLPQATLYTTLEPCTRDVRTVGLECCTDLILQHRIKKVFIGMLDPNQGVAGKGISRLQTSKVQVELFRPDFVEEIRTKNAAFIRTQETLGATIISPEEGDELHTYNTGGKHTIRFTCLNPPGDSNFLLISHDGLYWPQPPGQFHQIDNNTWTVVANFGITGVHTLQIVTANDLGKVLIIYYWKVVEQNSRRNSNLKDHLKGLWPKQIRLLLGETFPGIQMMGLPKGLTLEASVTVTIAEKPPEPEIK